MKSEQGLQSRAPDIKLPGRALGRSNDAYFWSISYWSYRSNRVIYVRYHQALACILDSTDTKLLYPHRHLRHHSNTHHFLSTTCCCAHTSFSQLGRSIDKSGMPLAITS